MNIKPFQYNQLLQWQSSEAQVLLCFPINLTGNIKLKPVFWKHENVMKQKVESR
jgi:hypothetical protein